MAAVERGEVDDSMITIPPPPSRAPPSVPTKLNDSDATSSNSGYVPDYENIDPSTQLQKPSNLKPVLARYQPGAKNDDGPQPQKHVMFVDNVCMDRETQTPPLSELLEHMTPPPNEPAPQPPVIITPPVPPAPPMPPPLPPPNQDPFK